MKAALLLTIVTAVTGRFMGEEVKAWFGWLHRKIRYLAVARLPETIRQRYEEEWESGLEEIPGELFKVIYSLGLLIAATGIREAAAPCVGERRPTVKRLLDITLSSVALAFLAPNLVLIAIAIKLDSAGPVLIAFPRLGRGQRPFSLLKFRTLTTGSDGKPRVTRLGRFLRTHFLDELPQFLNVIQGHMTLVGPPPQSPFGRNSADSYSVPTILTPGIIGRKDDDLPMNDKESGEHYAKNWSVWLDIRILLRVLSRIVTWEVRRALNKRR
jgi:lipopolysaccharide/colanic/teichoic acid biosynthesis glycosyltransferase